MALIKCPECGKEISDTAKNCIHCGYVLKQENIIPQPQTVVIAPEKGQSAKKSLNKGVTIILTVMSISLIAYMLIHIFGEVTEDFYSYLGISLYFSIASIVMSILIFAVPKLRKNGLKLYIYLSVSLLYLFPFFSDSLFSLHFLFT